MGSLAVPPNIVDPATGKTFVAIPAPSFVFLQDHSDVVQRPAFIYVERRPIQSRRVFSGGEVPQFPRKKPTISQWIKEFSPTLPPPSHLPWGDITFSMEETKKELISKRFPERSSVAPQPSNGIQASETLDSGLSLPSFETVSSLLRCTIPTIPSFDSFGSGDVFRSYQPTSHTTSSAKPIVSTPVKKIVQGLSSRPFSCFVGSSSRREALVIEPAMSSTAESKRRHFSYHVPAQDIVSDSNSLLSRLEELGTFFDDGIETANSSMRLLSKEKSRLTMPALVVSTSTAVIPVSLSSCTDIGGNKAHVPAPAQTPLAVRRGKQPLPPLSLKPTSQETVYPDVPTPFQALTPNSDSQSLSVRSVQPKAVSEMSEMIAQLEAQIQLLNNDRPLSPWNTEHSSAVAQENQEWNHEDVTICENYLAIDGALSEDTESVTSCDSANRSSMVSLSDLRSPVAQSFSEPSRDKPLPPPPATSQISSAISGMPSSPLSASSNTSSPGQSTCSSKVPLRSSMAPNPRLRRAMSSVGSTPSKKVRFATLPPQNRSSVSLPPMHDSASLGQPSRTYIPRVPSPLRESFCEKGSNPFVPAPGTISPEVGDSKSLGRLSLLRRMSSGSTFGTFNKSRPPIPPMFPSAPLTNSPEKNTKNHTSPTANKHISLPFQALRGKENKGIVVGGAARMKGRQSQSVNENSVRKGSPSANRGNSSLSKGKGWPLQAVLNRLR